MQGSTWARGRPPAPSVPGQGLPPLGPLPSSPRLSSPLAALASPSPSSAPPPCGLPNALSPAELLPPLCTGVHTLQTLSEGLSNAEALTDPNVHQPQPGEGCSRSPAGPSIHPPATGPSKGWVSWAAREQPGRWGTRGGGWRSSGSKPATSQPRMNECVFPSQHLAQGHSECPRRLQKDLGFPQSSPTGGQGSRWEHPCLHLLSPTSAARWWEADSHLVPGLRFIVVKPTSIKIMRERLGPAVLCAVPAHHPHVCREGQLGEARDSSQRAPRLLFKSDFLSGRNKFLETHMPIRETW